MTFGRFILILFVVSFAFVTTNIVLSFVNKQNVAQLSHDSKACQHCNLNKAELAGWNLSGFDLTSASIVGADLRCADLTDAILAGANLKASNLTGAKLEGADLLFTNMDKVIWEDGTDCDDIPPHS